MLTLTAVMHKKENIHIVECPEVKPANQRKPPEEPLHNLKEPAKLYFKILFSRKEGTYLNDFSGGS